MSRASLLFGSTRQILFFTFFVIWCVIDVVALGLVSQQLNRVGNVPGRWPAPEYYHVHGLLLFTTIAGLLFGIFHAWLPNVMVMFFFLTFGVMAGTVAGVLQSTPFNHWQKCNLPVSAFPQSYQSFVGQCSRVISIQAFSWVLFGLAVIGFFAVFFDSFSLTSKNSHIYIITVDDEEKQELQH